MKLNYLMLLMVAADSPDRLRRSDVERVMDEAHQADDVDGFRTWLLAHNDLRSDTRQAINEWSVN